MSSENEIKGAKGDYLQRGRPGRLTGRDFSPQDFPFDAWEFREYDKDDGNPRLTLKDDWILDPEVIQAYSMTVKQITAPASTPQIDGGTDVGSADAATYDGGETPSISADEVYNDNSGENDISGITSDAVVMESPVFFKEGISGDVQSLNFVSGSSGWKIEKDGDVEFNEGWFRGNIEQLAGTFNEHIDVGTTSADTTLSTGDARFRGDVEVDGDVDVAGDMKVTGALDWSNMGARSYSTTTITSASPYIVPSGVYAVYVTFSSTSGNYGYGIQIRDSNNSWRTISAGVFNNPSLPMYSTASYSGPSDGTNLRCITSGGTAQVVIIKLSD